MYARKKDDKNARKKLQDSFNSIAKAIAGPNLEELALNPLLCVEMAWVKDGPDSNKECEEWYSRALKLVGDDVTSMEMNVEVTNNTAVKMHLNGAYQA